MKIKMILIAVALFFTACTVAKPHVTEYTIAPKIQEQEYLAKSCREKSLKVGQIFSSNSLMLQKMKYIEGEYKEAEFTQSKWARTPNRAISDALVKSIRANNLFESVSSYKSRSKTDLLLETTLESFIQYFKDENKKSYVEIRLALNLINTKESKSIAHETFNVRVDTKSLDAQGGAIALNRALVEVLLNTNNWLDGVCR